MGIVNLISFVKDATSLMEFCELSLHEKHKTMASLAEGDDAHVSLKKMIFLIELDEIGENRDANDFMRREMTKLMNGQETCFFKSIAGLIVLSSSEHFTKTYAKKFIFLANQMGCEFVGHCMVERIAGHLNFRTWSKVLDLPLEKLEQIQIEKLISRVVDYKHLQKQTLKLRVLHAGHKSLSNTYMLWESIKESILKKIKESTIEDSNDDILDIAELHVEEGKIIDCHGCGFETCTYYSKQDSCFYGGFVVDSLYPAIEAADVVIWICPNYNDAISAKLMAVINRLTALYRKMPFYDKYIYSIIVSGNSGGDVVAEQLIDALNINKGFRLPPNFAAMAIANDPGDVKNSLDYEKRVCDYVNNMFELMNKNIKKN